MPDSMANKIIATGTILLGIVGIGSLLLTICSLAITRKAVEASREAADADVSATRAWITVLKEVPKDSTGTRINPTGVQIMNVGKTPAIGVVSTEEVLIRPQGAFPRFGYCPKDNLAQVGVLGPGESFQLTPPITLTKEETIAFLNPALTGGILVHGCLKYRNVGKMGGGLTEFCVMSWSTKMADCPNGNETE